MEKKEEALFEIDGKNITLDELINVFKKSKSDKNFQNKAEQKDGYRNSHYRDDDGINHSSLDLRAGVRLLVEILCQFSKHAAE